MKTTLNIDDSVMQRLREEAAQRGTTMSALVEAGLRRVLAAPEAGGEQRKALPPLRLGEAEDSGSISPTATRFTG